MPASEKNPVVPVNCLFQGCYNPEYEKKIREGKDLCFQYNKLHPNDFEAQNRILQKLLGSMGKETIITPPFWCDYGYNIEIGENFCSNHNLLILDPAKVTFGDNVMIGPNCGFYTTTHPLNPILRNKGYKFEVPTILKPVFDKYETLHL